jgi:hypothetical protein
LKLQKTGADAGDENAAGLAASLAANPVMFRRRKFGRFRTLKIDAPNLVVISRPIWN